MTDVGEDNLPCVVPLKAPIGQVRIMSKENLAMYALSHGLNIDPNVMTKGQMVDEIIQIIYGGSEE